MDRAAPAKFDNVELINNLIKQINTLKTCFCCVAGYCALLTIGLGIVFITKPMCNQCQGIIDGKQDLGQGSQVGHPYTEVPNDTEVLTDDLSINIPLLRKIRELQGNEVLTATPSPKKKKIRKDKKRKGGRGCGKVSRCMLTDKKMNSFINKMVKEVIAESMPSTPVPSTPVPTQPTPQELTVQTHHSSHAPVVFHLSVDMPESVKDFNNSTEKEWYGTDCSYSPKPYGILCKGTDGVYKIWKVADWVNQDHTKHWMTYDKMTGIITIEKDGFYLIYVQITFSTDSLPSTVGLYVEEEKKEWGAEKEPIEILTCSTGVGASRPDSPKFRSCYTAAPRFLKSKDELTVRDVRQLKSRITIEHSQNFWGVIKL